MNSVNFIGNLVREAEVKTFASGAKVANFTLAVNRKYKNASGQIDNDTCFIEVEAWGKMSELVSGYLKKGSKAGISGYLKQINWQDKEGKKHSKHIVFLEKLHFLDAGKKDSTPHKAPQIEQVPYIEFVDSESDDIPF